MPLLDHFHSPLRERRTWEGFHGLWAAASVETLNRDVLAADYYADVQVHIGGQVDVGIATLTETEPGDQRYPAGEVVVLEAPVWTPPATTLPVRMNASMPSGGGSSA